jgi:hypothetical protein
MMMRGKIVLLVGIGIGYVLGARAGRERYEDIKKAVRRFWDDPRVAHQVQNVEQFARDKAPEVVDFIGDTAKKVIQRTPAKSPSKSSATKTTDAPKKRPTAKPSDASASSTSAKK